MSDAMTIEEQRQAIREGLAEAIYWAEWDKTMANQGTTASTVKRWVPILGTYHYETADTILAIPEIKEGQELLEKAKSASGDECWICHAPLDKDGHCKGEALVPSESQKAGIDHCGGHDVFEQVCKYCHAVRDGTLENDNPRHWLASGESR
ncbi:hypothetical protein LCGC14_1151790 [marine sediment metagenome]|uniref:Uncharacterized protein n=1 Tax=marine sediment metagenome TaxID=412755 RepID=A0A0F9MIF8_9ZZZZ